MSAAGSDRNSGPGAPGQDDPNALVEDINRTRAELGDTVEALVAKVDVKARAQQRAAEVSTQAKQKLHALQQQLAGRAGQLTSTAADQAERARQAAAANGQTVLGAGASGGQTAGQAVQTAGQAVQTAGQAVQRGAQRATQVVNRHRVPFAAGTAAAVAVLAGWLAVRRHRR